ncbi:TspO/MBR family protein [Alteribacter keqinensis]|uniref:Tryptophan-rich sensory protein n=1 Tax=Alteribacter keqinensis TaxID=2483800 RepID=A0A3M7TN52_9BACI|nr:TspO/MBR family protein [Alteribacter keqinensis]RNA66818.1 tryptophan-rich sensory protein [Alteribacter keqinensis]
MNYQQSKILKWTNVFALVIVIVVNVLSNTLPINGQTAGEISDRLNVLFTPAGYVFSIWSVIYLLVIIWVFRQFFARPADEEAYANIGYWFVISCFFNVAWLLLFHYEYFLLTMVAMIGLLISLIIIYRVIMLTPHTTFFMRLPFSVYLGWVSVATIVNVGVVFNSLGFEEGLFLSNVTWTILLLIVALALGIWFTATNRDPFYSFVLVWAFIGIGVERQGEYPAIAVSAWAAAAILGLYLVYYFVTKKRIYQ